MDPIALDEIVDLVTTSAQLEAIYRQPSETVAKKIVGSIDSRTEDYLAASSFCIIATSDSQGRCDVSPRGGPPGFVRVLNATTLAIPDLSGNNLIDSLRNIVSNPHVGILSIVGGLDETVRFEGSARLTTDPGILGLWAEELRLPKLAIIVEVETLFLHCAKSFRRAKLWDPQSWPEGHPSAAELYLSQTGSSRSPQEMTNYLEAGYTRDLEGEKPIDP